MREIEFRLWCKNKNEWEKDAWFVSPNGIVHDMKRFIPMDAETHILEQFTGLKDKNGVKIFEGDILQIDDSDDLGYEFRGEKAEVYWQKERTGFRIRRGDFMRNILMKQDTEYYSVIGNIHQHPELFL